MKNNSAIDMYKEHILENYKNPNNFGELKEFTHQASSYNKSCGDEIKMQLKIEKNKVKEIRFSGKACAICTASASLLTEESKNKTLTEINQFHKNKIFELLGISVSPVRIKCALLPLETLHGAINGEK